jgi:TetR/AcrR family transcriptional regulator, repressor for uid operon
VPSKTPRLGRPPASSSAETRGRIIDVARRCFADHGYEVTTNRKLASEAGLTTAAMYHYFDSKLAIYKAVLDEVQQRVYDRFERAEGSAETFIGKIEAVYEVAHDLNRADASLARFLGASRIDRLRDPDLARELGAVDVRGEGFFEGIVDRGIETGEVASADRESVLDFIRAFNIGLTDGLSSDHDEHRRAVDGLLLVLRGYVAKN